VNRVWHGHFGQGIIKTPGDLGTQGALPSNQELLDFLATELIKSNWNTQHIHKLILKSHAYRQTANLTPASYAADPENRSWWGWKPYRMRAEVIRDSILQTSGELDLSRGGPSQKAENKSKRRSIYLEHRRNTPTYMNEIFDAPDASHSCSRRSQSISPIQSLYLLNSSFTNTQALRIAERIQKAYAEPQQQTEMLFLHVLGRRITPKERPVIDRFLKEASLKDLCLVLINSNEFIHVN
jgi:hypothetical protein